MKVLAVYGNPMRDGLIHGCVDFLSDYLAEKGIPMERFYLVERATEECLCIRWKHPVVESR